MGAYLKHDYKAGFVLTEENLVRIEDIIRKRVPELGEADIKLRIFRDDGLTVEYHKPSEFTQDNNLKSSGISEIHVVAEKDTFKIVIKFSRKDKSAIGMESEHRDQAFLISSDLKEYMSSEVFKHKKIRPDNLASVYGAFAVGSLIAFLYMIFVMQSSGDITYSDALNARDINKKLDFLIYRNGSVTSSIFYYLIIIPIVFVSVWATILWISRKLYPRNVFYFGREAEAFDKIRSLRDKLFWVVLIGLVISIVAAFIGSKWGIS